MMLFALLVLLGPAVMGSECVLTQRAGVPVNPQLFGYNLEVFGTMVNNSMHDTAGLS